MSPTETRDDLLGPLTTLWSLPSLCRGPIFFEDPSYCVAESTCTGFFGHTCRTFAIDDEIQCWPPYSTPTRFSEQSYAPETNYHGSGFAGLGFYSPGLECPEGYYSACSTTYGGSYNWQPQFPLTVGETAVGCCPSKFLCGENYSGQTCTLIASSTSLAGKVCNGSSPYHTTRHVPTSISDTYYGVVTIMEYILYAPLFQLNWQSSDRTHSSDPTATSHPEATSSESSSGMLDDSTSQNIPSNSSHGLSTSAKVGIGVGASIGFLALLALVWFILRYRRSKLSHAQQSADDTEPNRASELYSHFNPVPGRAAELFGREKYELPAEHTGSHQDGDLAGMQCGQTAMNGPYEMPDRSY